MQPFDLKAQNKDEAIQLIEAQTAHIVELNYEDGWRDIVEISRLGRKWRVAVIFRSHVDIMVESMSALLRGLNEEKDTFRQRHFYCHFDLSACSQEDIEQAESRAALLGDIILPYEILYSYQIWG